jgi:hypothetical protein
MQLASTLRYLSPLLSLALLIAPFAQPAVVRAGSLSSLTTHLSLSTANASGVQYTFNFSTGTSESLKRITFRFSTVTGGTTKPAGLSLNGATLGATTGIGTGWSIVTTSAASGILYIERTSAIPVDASTSVTVQFQGITNSAIDDCEPANDVLRDTCAVRVWTYSDDGSTEVDSGDTTYTVDEDPYFLFQIEDVPTSTAQNGITANISTANDSIAFGRLSSGDVRYGMHKLTISTNAPHGYTIYAKLLGNLSGSYYVSEIDPFGGTNATWNTPQLWSSPTGTTPGTHTGWLGANTNDTRVSGWGSGASRFAPIGVIDRPVATSTGPDRNGSTVYVSYALEVNGVQPSDVYQAVLVFDARPIF